MLEGRRVCRGFWAKIAIVGAIRDCVEEIPGENSGFPGSDEEIAGSVGERRAIVEEVTGSVEGNGFKNEEFPRPVGGIGGPLKKMKALLKKMKAPLKKGKTAAWKRLAALERISPAAKPWRAARKECLFAEIKLQNGNALIRDLNHLIELKAIAAEVLSEGAGDRISIRLEWPPP